MAECNGHYWLQAPIKLPKVNSLENVSGEHLLRGNSILYRRGEEKNFKRIEDIPRKHFDEPSQKVSAANLREFNFFSFLNLES